MLKHLKRWLGWESESDLLDLAAPSSRPTSAPPPAPKPPVVAQARRIEQPPPQRQPKDPRAVLDNPRLTLDKPADDGFDPYNTGAFNRSASWERIGRQRKR